MSDEEKLPVRVVRSEPIPKSRKPGGGPPKEFFETEEEFSQKKKSLIQDIDYIREYFQESFEKYPRIPHVSRVQLVEKAIAKSHRPRYLFSKDTCPIIGVGGLGHLLVRTERKRLSYLKKKIEQEPNTDTTKDKWRSNIGAISNLDPFKESDRLRGETPESLTELLKRDERSVIKVKLFNFFDPKANLITKEGFISIVNRLNLSLSSVGEITGLEMWKVNEIDIESLRELAKFPAIREISIFPRYGAIQPPRKQTKSSVLIPPPEAADYPVVGLLDTGMPENHSLSPWIVESTNHVPHGLSNHFHGCSVGALLIMAHRFNSLDIDEGFLKITNVEILGNTNKDLGNVDVVYEDGFIKRLENYFGSTSSIPRIWNMSLGLRDDLCEFRRFSDLAVFLDKLQDQRDLLFVLPSGNYNKTPFRTWPPQTEDIGVHQIDENDPDLPPDYLSKPADCIRAITVGAIACDRKEISIVGKDQPTSYSRRGPGPSFVPKPEVVQYSGNVSVSENGKLDCTGQGIKSLDERGRIIECAGTSYAAPLVSRALAFLSHYIEPEPSSLLLKALLIHNARMLKSFESFENCFYYVGFGHPVRAIDVLFCSPYEITLVFEGKIRLGNRLEYPFYWPDSLRVGEKIRGEVKATLVSRPPLNEAFGAEYVRADVRFSLQSKTTKKSGKERWEGIVPEDPCKWELRRRYESNLIKEAFKWAPVKRYRKEFPRGKKSEGLRIRIELFLRDGVDMDNFKSDVDFVLILAIGDPKRKAPVYNEVTSRLRSHGVITEGIRLRGRAREIVS